MPESFLRRVRRRAITVPGVLVAFVLTTAALPALVLIALALDLARGRRTLASARMVVLLEAFLGTECLGLALLAVTWLLTLGAPARREALTFRVQRLYTALHLASLRGIFAVRIEVEGDALLGEGGPLLVFSRHASIADVILPGGFIANRHGYHLRYVLKRELLIDPCLDVAGHWIPNHFVARDGVETTREIEAIRALKAGLGPRDGVLIYPEGTRFTAQKRARLLDKLGGDPDARARASRLRHLLPIRPGGALGLLDAPPACDLIFLGHAGLEGLTSIADLASGALVGRTIQIRFHRVRAAAIPASPADRLAFLDAEWQRIDDWLSALVAEGAEG